MDNVCIRSLSGAGTAADFDIPPVCDGQLGVVPGVEVQDVQACVEGGGAAGAGAGRGRQHHQRLQQGVVTAVVVLSTLSEPVWNAQHSTYLRGL